jgi:hypothetical protein
MNDKIKTALLALDPEKDAHWTTDNLPRLDVMKELVGAEVSRADIQAVSKSFNRKNPVIEAEKPPAPTPGTPPAPAAQETTEPDATEDLSANMPDVDKAVEVEYEKAGQALIAARQRYQKAQEAMDEVIAHREKESAKITFADTVKQFQESQRKQREARVGQAKALSAALKTTDGSKV